LRQFEQLKNFILNKLVDELPAHLTYHNIDHTQDVMQAAARLAVAEGIDEAGKDLLAAAALLHDAGFLIGREGHEQASCDIARCYLPAYGYTPEEIDVVCGLIMATRLPQSPDSKLAEILCDADLDYLGRDDFFMLSGRLFTELKNEGLMQHEEQWNRRQADFMGSHSYFTKTAINLRQPRQEHHVELIKLKITV
jgi:exopolyphosphatase/pppGpp-phosphohydrolase